MKRNNMQHFAPLSYQSKTCPFQNSLASQADIAIPQNALERVHFLLPNADMSLEGTIWRAGGRHRPGTLHETAETSTMSGSVRRCAWQVCQMGDPIQAKDADFLGFVGSKKQVCAASATCPSGFPRHVRPEDHFEMEK